MSKNLVIVESPAKCKKIEGFLGPGFKCMASFGHLQKIASLKDINIGNNFSPTYTLIDEKIKQNQIEKLRSAIAKSSEVVLACDDDREGEFIAYSICQIFNLNVQTTKRILFHEITESAIKYAITHPKLIDMDFP